MNSMQSLTNLSLDKIVGICVQYEEGTRKAGEDDDLEAGKWLMDTWRCIRASPVLKEKGYERLNFALQTTNFNFQILTLNPNLELECFERNDELFVEIEKAILSSQKLRKHLEKNVKVLKIIRVSNVSNKHLINRLIPIDQILSHLKSLKNFCCLSYEIKSESLMQSLSSSSDLTIFQAECSIEIYFKYILGIELGTNIVFSLDDYCENLLNSQYRDSVVQQSRPVWPELTIF